jgi:hypothetical protein
MLIKEITAQNVNKGNNGHKASIKVEMSSGTVMNGHTRYQSAGHDQFKKRW